MRFRQGFGGGGVGDLTSEDFRGAGFSLIGVSGCRGPQPARARWLLRLGWHSPGRPEDSAVKLLTF